MSVIAISMTKLWIFVKKYWHYLALTVAALVGVLIFRKDLGSFIESYQKIKDVHDDELKKVDEARKEERVQKEAASKKLESTLRTIEERYEANNQALDKKKKKEVEKIVKTYSDDPELLAEELAKVTGYRIILPEAE